MIRLDGDWLRVPATQVVCKALTDQGAAVHFVGGCVRNALLGVPVTDIDLSTDVPPDRVMAIAEAAGIKAVPTGIDHGTVTLVVDGLPHEVTTYRRDVETDGRRAVVAFSDRIEDDALRRDFTMNALYATPEGRVVDPLGGLRDLQARRVRFVGRAEDRLAEDYLRALRFFRFHAFHGDPGGGLDAEALAAIAACPERVAGLSKERITCELLKLMRATDPAPATAAMAQTGLLSRLLPGADVRALAPLVHLQTEHGLPADPIVRLAAVAAIDAPSHLRLSKADKTAFDTIHVEARDTRPATELGYAFGAAQARSILALRAALAEVPLVASDLHNAGRGGDARFPLKAADLMPALSGPALGRKLKALEAFWISNDFQPTRAELLERALKG